MVKIATRGLCMETFSEIELLHRGLWKGYFFLDDKKKLDKFAFVWIERYRKYFISKTSYLKPGIPYARDRLRQLDGSPNEAPVCVRFEINQPKVSEIYDSRN